SPVMKKSLRKAEMNDSILGVVLDGRIELLTRRDVLLAISENARPQSKQHSPARLVATPRKTALLGQADGFLAPAVVFEIARFDVRIESSKGEMGTVDEQLRWVRAAGDE